MPLHLNKIKTVASINKHFQDTFLFIILSIFPIIYELQSSKFYELFPVRPCHNKKCDHASRLDHVQNFINIVMLKVKLQ